MPIIASTSQNFTHNATQQTEPVAFAGPKPATRDTADGSTWFQMVNLADPADYREKSELRHVLERPPAEPMAESSSESEDEIIAPRRTRSSLIDSALKLFTSTN